MKEETKQRIIDNNFTLYLNASSSEGDRDWYGDFNYGPNPLSRFASCKKHAVCICYDGSSHGYGTAEIDVYTTKEFVEMMGWEDILTYKKENKIIKEDKQNNSKQQVDLMI